MLAWVTAPGDQCGGCCTHVPTHRPRGRAGGCDPQERLPRVPGSAEATEAAARAGNRQRAGQTQTLCASVLMSPLNNNRHLIFSVEELQAKP